MISQSLKSRNEGIKNRVILPWCGGFTSTIKDNKISFDFSGRYWDSQKAKKLYMRMFQVPHNFKAGVCENCGVKISFTPGQSEFVKKLHIEFEGVGQYCDQYWFEQAIKTSLSDLNSSGAIVRFSYKRICQLSYASDKARDSVMSGLKIVQDFERAEEVMNS